MAGSLIIVATQTLGFLHLSCIFFPFLHVMQPRCEVESICGQETVFPEKATGKDLELHYLEEELELLKEAVKMALDDESSFSSIAEQLSEQIATRNENLQEAKKQW